MGCGKASDLDGVVDSDAVRRHTTITLHVIDPGAGDSKANVCSNGIARRRVDGGTVGRSADGDGGVGCKMVRVHCHLHCMRVDSYL